MEVALELVPAAPVAALPVAPNGTRRPAAGSLEMPDPLGAHRSPSEEDEAWPGEGYRYPDVVTEAPSWATPADREWYPCHIEENMAERPRHSINKLPACAAIESHCPDKFAITEMELYYEQGSRKHVVPDLMVMDSRPTPDEAETYLAWRDPPIRCVVEIVSRRNTPAHLEEKRVLYARLRVREYIEHDPYRRALRLWRLQQAEYHPVDLQPDGWVWSAETRLYYALDEAGNLRFKDRAGRRWRPPPEQLAQLLATEAELEEQRAAVALREVEVAEARDAHHEAEARAAVAELRATAEAEHRRLAEQRAADAIARAAAEEEQRRAAEARAAELELLLARLAPPQRNSPD